MSAKKLIHLELAKKDADKIVEDTVRDFGLDFSLKVINELEKSFLRIKKYPKGSSAIVLLECCNSVQCEKDLLSIFKQKFTQNKYYGLEYFVYILE